MHAAWCVVPDLHPRMMRRRGSRLTKLTKQINFAITSGLLLVRITRSLVTIVSVFIRTPFCHGNAIVWWHALTPPTLPIKVKKNLTLSLNELEYKATLPECASMPTNQWSFQISSRGWQCRWDRKCIFRYLSLSEYWNIKTQIMFYF